MDEQQPQENNVQPENKELTQHEKKQIKKQKRHEEKQQKHESKSKKETQKNIVKYSIGIIVVILIIFGGYYFIIKPIRETQPQGPFTNGPVHWHANFEVSICGQVQDFTHGYDFEHDAIGTPILHTHNDNIIHIEGQIPRKGDIAIGNFFDNIRVPFSSTQIMDKKNGALCPDGHPGTVKMYVNGQQNYEFRNFTLSACTSRNIREDCDHIEIRFE